MKYTVIVNKTNPIKNNYINKINLVKTKNVLGEEVLLEEETLNAYNELKKFLETKNIYIGIDAGYRTVDDQIKLSDEFISKYGKEYTSKYLALPRCSEHHTGLAIDLNIKIEDKYQDNNYDLEKYDNVFRIIHKHLHKFGFILRYPKGKEKITTFPYESWHIRYVGKVVSKIIHDNNYTLEEYVNNFGGVLLINKEKGMTSFDVIRKLTNIFGIKKIGHTGTLDPLAEGVLVVVIGKALKIAEILTSNYKEYEAGVLLGTETDTLDITGKIVKTKVYVDKGKLEEVINSYKKTYLQEVPKYSAVKVKGKKLYEYARDGIEVELPKKEVTIKEIELLSNETNSFEFRCLVSKGCYIRSLIRDIGNSLDTYATMTKLVRTKQGKFKLEDSYKLKDIKNNKFKILSIIDALDYPIIEVDEEIKKKVLTGQKVLNTYNIKDKVLFTSRKDLLGIYIVDNNMLKVWKNFK